MEKRPAFTTRLTALWNRPLSRRAMACLCAAWLLLIMLPLFVLCFYAYPAYDDFINILPATEVWARTGDVWAVLRSVIEGTIEDYNQWQGTFVAMFQGRFQPMIFSLDWFWLTPFLTLALFYLAVWFFVRQVCRLMQIRDRLTELVVYTLLLTLLLAFMPGIREAVFWQAATQYILSFLFLMPMLGLLIGTVLSSSWWGRLWRGLLAALCAFLGGACPYPVALGAAVGLAAIALWCFCGRSKAQWASLGCLMALLLSLLLVIIAPGNSVRQERIGDSLSPLMAIVYSVDAFLENSSQWLGPQWLILLAAVPLLWQPLKQSSFRFAHPFWAAVFALGTAAAAFVPPIYAMGPNGYQYDRILASLYLWFALCLFVLLLYLCGWLARRLENAPMRLPSSFRIWQAALCLVLVIWGLFGHSIFASPTIGAWKCLLTGEAQVYQQEIRERENCLLEAETLSDAQSSVKELSVAPAMFPNDLLIYQASNSGSVPLRMHQYFRLMELLDQYGAGNIPEAEWQALDAWRFAQ